MYQSIQQAKTQSAHPTNHSQTESNHNNLHDSPKSFIQSMPQAMEQVAAGTSSTQLNTAHQKHSALQKMVDQSTQIAHLNSHQNRAFVSTKSQAIQEHSALVQKQIQERSFLTNESDKVRFLSQLKTQIQLKGDAILASIGQSTAQCPYIRYWFEHYADQDIQHIKKSLIRFQPETAYAQDAEQAITLIVEKIVEGLQNNVATGSLDAVPSDIPRDLETPKSELSDAPEPTQLVAQLCETNQTSVVEDMFTLTQQKRNFYYLNKTKENLEAWRNAVHIDNRKKGGYPLLSPQNKKRAENYFSEIERQRPHVEKSEREERARLMLEENASRDPFVKGKIEEEQNTYINDYINPDTGKTETHFNDPLRKGNMSEQQENDIRGLYTALLHRPISRIEQLWRGSKTCLIGGTDPELVEEGKSYTEVGFLSTSEARKTAEGFAGGSGYLICITGNKSGREIISLGDNTGIGEQEILFPANRSFVYDRFKDGVYYYHEA
jgi:hypothetical protein